MSRSSPSSAMAACPGTKGMQVEDTSKQRHVASCPGTKGMRAHGAVHLGPVSSPLGPVLKVTKMVPSISPQCVFLK